MWRAMDAVSGQRDRAEDAVRSGRRSRLRLDESHLLLDIGSNRRVHWRVLPEGAFRGQINCRQRRAEKKADGAERAKQLRHAHALIDVTVFERFHAMFYFSSITGDIPIQVPKNLSNANDKRLAQLMDLP